MIKVTMKHSIVILGLREITTHLAKASGLPYQSKEWFGVSYKDYTESFLLEYVSNVMFPNNLKVELND